MSTSASSFLTSATVEARSRPATSADGVEPARLPLVLDRVRDRLDVDVGDLACSGTCPPPGVSIGRFSTSVTLSRNSFCVQTCTSYALPPTKMSPTSSLAISADDCRRTWPGVIPYRRAAPTFDLDLDLRDLLDLLHRRVDRAFDLRQPRRRSLPPSSSGPRCRGRRRARRSTRSSRSGPPSRAPAGRSARCGRARDSCRSPP